jgi:hypothetical protein
MVCILDKAFGECVASPVYYDLSLARDFVEPSRRYILGLWRMLPEYEEGRGRATGHPAESTAREDLPMVGTIEAIAAPRANSDSISSRSGWVQTWEFEPFPESAICRFPIIKPIE